jgi:hypothetical protein
VDALYSAERRYLLTNGYPRLLTWYPALQRYYPIIYYQMNLLCAVRQLRMSLQSYSHLRG